MGSSDSEGSLKKKERKEKKDKHKKDKHKDEKKDKHKDEKKDKHGDEKKDKHKDEKKDKHKDEKDKHKEKDKKVKDRKDKPSQPSGVHVSSGPAHGGEAANFYNASGAPPQPHLQPAHPSHPGGGEDLWFLREPGTGTHDQHPPRTQPDFPNSNPPYNFQQPPQQQPFRAVSDGGGIPPLHSAPPSGYRLPLGPNAPFPSPDRLGQPPTTDSSGPIFIGSAIFPDSVHPCKIIPSLYPPCRVTYGGGELEHHGRFDLLPITQDMEWVPAGNGQIPPGRRPVEGGYEPNSGKLYHALGSIQGVYVPGKAGEHLRGASIPFGGSEHYLQENYSILCWR